MTDFDADTLDELMGEPDEVYCFLIIDEPDGSLTFKGVPSFDQEAWVH